MSTASLLNLPTDNRAAIGFVFDHDQEHRSLFNRIASPSEHPALIDPAPIAQTSRRAGNWQFDHQIAHDDFNAALFDTRFGRQNIADSDLTSQASLEWWTFVNHHEHYLANSQS